MVSSGAVLVTTAPAPTLSSFVHSRRAVSDRQSLPPVVIDATPFRYLHLVATSQGAVGCLRTHLNIGAHIAPFPYLNIARIGDVHALGKYRSGSA